jgi:hypothetical protein
MRLSLTNFIKSRYFLLIYPSILLAGRIVSWFLSNDQIVGGRGWYWFSSRNFVNILFAHHGNLIFAIGFVLICGLRCLERYDGSMTQVRKVLLEFSFKFMLKYVGLYFLFLFIDHLFILTGGSCQIESSNINNLLKDAATLKQCSNIYGTWQNGACSLTSTHLSQMISDAQECRQFGEWNGGFDVSGHFCFLVTLSLILWYELLRFHDTTNDTENQKTRQNPAIPVKWITITILCIWLNMLFVTAMLYHTFLEKILGLGFGYITPMIIYNYIPRYTSLYS